VIAAENGVVRDACFVENHAKFRVDARIFALPEGAERIFIWVNR